MSTQDESLNEYLRALLTRLPTLARAEGKLQMAPQTVRQLVREAFAAGFTAGGKSISQSATPDIIGDFLRSTKL